MVFIIVIASIVTLAVALAIFILVRYVPIIARLFMNVTVRPGRDDGRRFEGEDVSFETADGVRLAGTFAPPMAGAPRAPIIVFCHAFTENRHSAVRYAGFLREEGFRLFTFDFRAHGESGCPEGYTARQWVTEGEVFDVRAALRYLRSRPDTAGCRIAFFGISRGAVAALMVAGAEPSIAAVVSDGAFSTVRVLDAYIHRWAPIFVPSRTALRVTPKSVFHFYRNLALGLAQHRLGVKFLEIKPALKRLRANALFIHGACDSYLDVAGAEEIRAAAAGPSDLWVVPDADHNEAVETAPEEYRRRIGAFFRESLGAGAPAATARPATTPS